MNNISDSSSENESLLKKNFKGITLCVLQSFFYSLQFVVIKVTNDNKLASPAQIQIATSFSLLLLGLYKAYTQERFHEFRKISLNFDTLLLLVRSLGQALSAFFGYIAINQMRINSYTSILYSFPIFASFFSCMLTDEKLTKSFFLKGLTNFCGVLLITRPFSINDKDSYIGFLNVTLSMLLWAIMPVASKLSQKAFDVSIIYILAGCFNIALSYFILLPFEPKQELYFLSYICFFILGLLRCCGIFCFDLLCMCSDLVVVMPFEYSIFFFTMSFDYFTFGTHVDLWDVLGVLIILFSNFYELLVLLWREKYSKKDVDKLLT